MKIDCNLVWNVIVALGLYNVVEALLDPIVKHIIRSIEDGKDN